MGVRAAVTRPELSAVVAPKCPDVALTVEGDGVLVATRNLAQRMSRESSDRTPQVTARAGTLRGPVSILPVPAGRPRSDKHSSLAPVHDLHNAHTPLLWRWRRASVAGRALG